MEQAQTPNGYRQNRELAIICVLWGVLIFFRLSDLIGAVGLRQYYSALALWLCLASLITIPALLWIWKLGIVGRLLTVGIFLSA